MQVAFRGFTHLKTCIFDHFIFLDSIVLQKKRWIGILNSFSSLGVPIKLLTFGCLGVINADSRDQQLIPCPLWFIASLAVILILISGGSSHKIVVYFHNCKDRHWVVLSCNNRKSKSESEKATCGHFKVNHDHVPQAVSVSSRCSSSQVLPAHHKTTGVSQV